MKPIQRIHKPATSLPGRSNMQQEFGFGSDFVRRVSQHLEPVIQHILTNYFKKGARGHLFVPRQIPAALEKKAILEVLNPRYFWRDFIQHPDILSALREDHEYDYWEKFLSSPNFLRHEEKLLVEWQSQRGPYYQFAHSNTLFLLSKYPPREKALQQSSYLALMAAYRYLDAVVTGRQNLLPHPAFGGEDGLEFTISVPGEGAGRNPLVIRIGSARRAEYGTSYRNTDQILLEAIYAETNPAASNFNQHNCVVQVSRLLCPLLELTRPEFPDELILDLLEAGRKYQEVNVISPLPEHDMGNTRLHLGRARHLEKRFSQTWFSLHSLSPLWLDMSGFRPFHNSKIFPLVEDLNARYREVVGLDKVSSRDLVWARTREIILLPILNRCLQLRCLQLFQASDPQNYQSILEASAEKAPESDSPAATHLFQLDFCYRQALQILSAAPHQTLRMLAQHQEPEVRYMTFKQH